jgi:type I restriction enzyme S subunit
MMLQQFPLSSLAKVFSGGGAPQDQGAFTATGHPFIRAGSLPKLLNGASEESLEKIESTTAEKYGLNLFPIGTVLFAKSGMSATKGHIYRLRRPSYVVNHLAALVSHEPGDSAFLGHALYRFPPMVLIKDPAYPSIRLGDIGNMKIPAPPKPSERWRIAEVLDRAEALRAKRRAALAQLDTLTQAIFLDLFGNPFSNSKNWPITRLMNVSLAINDCPHSTPFWTAHGAICLRTSNLNEGGWNWEDTRYVSEETFAQRSSRGFLETGDIILSREGTVGIAAIVPDGLRMCMGQRLVQVRAADDKLVPEFLLYYLLQILVQDRISQFMVGSTSQHLNVKELRNLPVPLPPLLLQRDFARRIAAVEKLKAAHRASLVEMDALFASLQHRAFQGEL